MSTSKTQSEDPEDVKKALAPLHEEWLVLGKLLASRLNESLRAQLNALKGIKPLRHEFRHAPTLANATRTAVRCAVAITELSHTLESLVYQKVKGRPMQIRLSSASEIEVVNKQKVQGMYFAERIANAIGCEHKVAWDL